MSWGTAIRFALGTCGLASATVTAHAFASADDGLHPAHFEWSHRGLLTTLDHSAYVFTFDNLCPF